MVEKMMSLKGNLTANTDSDSAPVSLSVMPASPASIFAVPNRPKRFPILLSESALARTSGNDNLRRVTCDRFSRYIRNFISVFLLLSTAACAVGSSSDKYRDETMDFGSVQNVAVLPFANLSRDQQAAERVRDVFVTALLATGGIYVIPTGEVAKGIGQAGMANAAAPSSDDVKKIAPIVKANAVITGVLREYGEVRSGTSTANVISLSLQMLEAQTGRVVWSASVTKGGIGLKDRLLGGGGEPLNTITEKAIKDLIDQLYE